jgi:hypothetical protein
MTPEAELVRCCARAQLDADASTRITALVEQRIDWPEVFQMASDHCLTPLVGRHLQDVGAGLLPPDTLRWARDASQENARRSLYLLLELVDILVQLEAAGVREIPFKGPVLAIQAYGNVALRQFLDLDVLVAPEDLGRATRVLRGRGYQIDEADRIPERALARFGYEQSFRRGQEFLVELQWRLWPRYFSFDLSVDRLRARAMPMPLGGRTVFALCHEDALLTACVHGTKHLWQQIVCICDVAELMRTSPIDWDRLMSEARLHGSERMLFLGVALASTVLGAPVPLEISRRVESDRVVVAVAARIRERLFRFRPVEPPIASSAAFHLTTRERLRDKVRYVARLAILPTVEDWKSLKVPAACAPLQYLARPVRLAARYGRTLLPKRKPLLPRLSTPSL